MTFLRAFVVHEWRTQLRSTRYRLLVALYLVASMIPVLYQLLLRGRSDVLVGTVSYLQPTFELQVFLVSVLSTLIAMDAIERERSEGAWAVVGLTGVSNASYLLARWCGVLATLLPWTLLPPLLASLLPVALGLPAAEVGHYFLPWLLWVLPSLLAASGGALAIGTITGSWIGFLLFYFGLTLVASPVLLQLLARFHTTWESADWPHTSTFAVWLSLVLQTNAPESQRFGLGQISFSEAPMDLYLTLDTLLAHSLFVLTLAVCLLGPAVLFLRRTAPDVRPWRISPKHPLRTYLNWLSNLRMRYWPDPRPLAADLAVLGLAALLLLAVSGYRLARSEQFQRLAAERFAAEMNQEALVNPRTLVPERYALRGRLMPDGQLQADADLTFRNTGSEELPALMLQLNAGLDAQPVDEGVSVQRQWDRLRFDLQPPLAAGESRTLHLRLEGHSEMVDFRLRGIGNMPFNIRYQNFLNATRPQDLSELGHSSRYRKAQARSVYLTGASLLPLPRYTTWQLTPPPTSPGGPGSEVPEEQIFPVATFELDLEVPTRWLLASACGELVPAETQTRTVTRTDARSLRSSCRLPLDRVGVLGGPLVLVTEDQPSGDVSSSRSGDTASEPGKEPLRLAILPQHRPQAALHRPALNDARKKLDEAWPGVTSGRGLIFLERPMPASGFSGWWRSYFLPGRERATFGKVVLVSEVELVRTQPLATNALVSELARAQIRHSRTIVGDQELLMAALLDHLVLQRLGELEDPSAVVHAKAWLKDGLRESILDARLPWGTALSSRLPALLHYLQYLVGTPNLYQAVDRFLLQSGESPIDQAGSLSELMDLLEEISGVDLQGFRQQLLTGSALPEPVLRDVRFQRQGNRWLASGRVVNEGDGEVRCPLVLFTDLTPAETVVEVGSSGASAGSSNASVSFQLATSYPPQALALDPGGKCFRFARDGHTRVEYRP